MTNKEIKSCVGTIEMLRRLAYNIHGVMDVIDADNCEKIIKALEQEPCEDCISRAELLAKIDEERKHLLNLKMDGAEHIIVHHARRIIEDMPSVTPQPKIGEWLEKEVNSDKVIEEWQSARCSVCDKYHTTPYMYYFDNYKFCPNSGAKMEVEEI